MRANAKNPFLSLLALASLLLAAPLGAQVFTYTCSVVPGTGCRSQIPDATSDGVTTAPGVLSSTITVPPGTCGGLLADVDLNYSFRHDWVGDLRFEIAPPGGAGVPAGAIPGVGSGDDFMVTQPVFRTTFPSLTGANPNGTWTFRAIDGASANVGALEDWTLSIVCQGTTPSVPFVSVVASPASAVEEPGAIGMFVFQRSVVDGTPLVVHFTLGGTAGPADTAPLPLTVTIPAGAASATLLVEPVADDLPEPAETVVLTLLDVPAYDPGATLAATVTITDRPFATVIPATSTLGLLFLALTIAAGGFALVRGRLA